MTSSEPGYAHCTQDIFVEKIHGSKNIVVEVENGKCIVYACDNVNTGLSLRLNMFRRTYPILSSVNKPCMLSVSQVTTLRYDVVT